MRILPPDFENADGIGFTEDNDIFGRKPIADGLTRLVERVDHSLVIAINGNWGSGKTTFLRQWENELKSGDIPTIHFDAFENDYHSDAFLALASRVFEAAEQLGVNTAAKRKFKDRAVGLGKVMAQSALKIGARAATLNLIGGEDASNLAKDFATEVGSLAELQIKDILTGASTENKVKIEFRDALAAIPASIGEGEKPLIFVIDELDRCRPDFALSIIEAIKHFFSVENVHFILGVHLKQLENSVNATYGSNIDANMYLQKFINVVVPLDNRGTTSHQKVVNRYILHVFGSVDVNPWMNETVHYTKEYIERFAEAYGLSLRSIERIITNVALCLSTIPRDNRAVPPLIAGLATIKCINLPLYEALRENKFEAETLDDFLKIPPPSQLEGNGYDDFQFERDWWYFATNRKEKMENPNSFSQVTYRYNSSRPMVSFLIDRYFESFEFIDTPTTTESS